MLASTEKLLETPPLATYLPDLMHNIILEIKYNSDFRAGETLFYHLLKRLQLQDSLGRPADVYSPDKPNFFSRDNRPFGEKELVYFRKSIASMIRYSPQPETGLRYASFLLNQIQPPLRDAQTEVTVLINLIYIYSKDGSDAYMKAGLDFVMIGLERGLPLYRNSGNERKRAFNNPGTVFSTVSKPILKYHNLQPTHDGKGVEKFGVFNSGGYIRPG
ncbi:hypothetical protein BDA99DRAFT_532918 [Phascolomyces articulosus]|uniref:Uncharacterized protein n=1 Tax=Phascolomyces articulosus TaxID=60185 RepID=A0AAD5KQU9_9FUNG|nr:hypothetical protein BDA99DRAFT_532918 [Phascolomyces articulosus]